jgi:hypothetical protein
MLINDTTVQGDRKIKTECINNIEKSVQTDNLN